MTDLDQLLEQYERRALDHLSPPRLDLSKALDGLEFTRITGMSAFWRTEGAEDYSIRATDLAISAHSWQGWFATVFTGSGDTTEIYIAIDRLATARRLLPNAYPGICFGPSSSALGSSLRNRFEFAGLLTGIPAPRFDPLSSRASDKDETAHLSRIIRGMRGSEWIYTVRAWPRQLDETLADREALLHQLDEVLPFVRQNVQRTIQATRQPTDHQSQTLSEIRGSELINPRAEYLVELMKNRLSRVDDALASGQWQVAVDFGAATEADARRLGGLLRGIFSGDSASGDRIRTFRRGSFARNEENIFHSHLSSRELGRLIELPQEETPGFDVRLFVRFGVDGAHPFKGEAGTHLLGRLEIDGAPGTLAFSIRHDDLQKHALVAGVTGSGKTTTVRGILKSIQQAGLSFLVIEPAKTEYRSLLPLPHEQYPSKTIPNLRIYTLGNDHVSPFRINPFEFETSDDPSHTFLLEHIDLLKSAFNSAFILYAPMPYILETALFEIYEDKGWHLASGQNMLLPSENWSDRHKYNIFPTLFDLESKVVTVTRRLGYDTRIEQDVIAGLQTRISTLRLGAKGLMLDIPRGKPMRELLRETAVLELEHIGNDNEKAFVIGLILIRLYEFRRLQSSEGKLPGGLQHLLVVEEAHRLLQNVNLDVDTESSNLRAQAVETFINMFSEVRKYGQGIVVAEQIPSKLAPDVIKNSNLKVLHRLVAQDDRELVAGATNMAPEQTRHLSILDTGTAAIYREGVQQPNLVQIQDVLSGITVKERKDSDVHAVMSLLTDLSETLSVSDFASYGIPTSLFGVPDAVRTHEAFRFVTKTLSSSSWARLLQRLVLSRETVLSELLSMKRKLMISLRQHAHQQVEPTLQLSILFGAELAISERQSENGWTYPIAEMLRAALTHGLLGILRNPESSVTTSALYSFAQRYKTHTNQSQGPFPGCVHCRVACLHGADVSRLMTPPLSRKIVDKLYEPSSTMLEKYRGAADLAIRNSASWLGLPAQSKGNGNLAYCAVLHAIAGLPEHEQADIGDKIESHLL